MTSARMTGKQLEALPWRTKSADGNCVRFAPADAANGAVTYFDDSKNPSPESGQYLVFPSTAATRFVAAYRGQMLTRSTR